MWFNENIKEKFFYISETIQSMPFMFAVTIVQQKAY